MTDKDEETGVNCFNPESLQKKWFCSPRLHKVVNDTKPLKHKTRENQDWRDQRQNGFVNRNSKFCEEVKQSYEYRALFFHSSAAACDSGSRADCSNPAGVWDE